MDSVPSSSNGDGDVSVVSNVNHLMYTFDVEDPWKYFPDGVPVASSVERGRKQTRPKYTKIYISKQKKTFTARKNRAHGDIAKMCLLCSCEQDCLMKQGQPRETRLMIQQLRQRLFRKDYNEQNYILARQMEVKVCPSGVRRITYKIPRLGNVCRGAFQKCYGISKAKITVLLKKMDVDGVSIQPDMRGRHEHRTTKLLPEARSTVIDYICSYKATESHYRRAKTNKKYFDCNVSMKRMWQDFCKKHPHFKANRSKIRNKGPVISFSTFRNIFQQNIRDTLSFRKARMDSCQYCDKTQNIITQISSEIKGGNLRRAGEMERLKTELELHLKESEVRFASLKYDMLVLSKKD